MTLALHLMGCKCDVFAKTGKILYYSGDFGKLKSNRN
jgi:hypothetical protein